MPNLSGLNTKKAKATFDYLQKSLLYIVMVAKLFENEVNVLRSWQSPKHNPKQLLWAVFKAMQDSLHTSSVMLELDRNFCKMLPESCGRALTKLH